MIWWLLGVVAASFLYDLWNQWRVQRLQERELIETKEFVENFQKHVDDHTCAHCRLYSQGPVCINRECIAYRKER